MVMAHRFPINSSDAYLSCIGLGAQGTEIDVQMTADGVLVAFHDKFMEHSTNLKGPVFEKTWNEIQEAYYTNPPYSSYRVVSLDALLSSMGNPEELVLFLDCKAYNPDTSQAYRDMFIQAIRKLADRHHLAKNLFIELSRKDLIRSLKTQHPSMNLFAYVDFEEGLELATSLDLSGITISEDHISKQQVLQAHQQGVMIAVFNTRTKHDNWNAVEKNVDFIQSDRIRHLLRILR